MESSAVLIKPELTEVETSLYEKFQSLFFRLDDFAKVRISIITPTFNSAATVKDTLESVRLQDYSDIEHIIVDGGSTDDTLKILRDYPHVKKWVSEKDGGIYDAMNKGIRMATGDVIGILNSDDVYTNSKILTKIAGCFNDKNTQTVYGDLQYVKACDLDKVIRYWRSGHFKRTSFYYGWMPPHPTFFVRKEVYEKAGLFNLSLRNSADYEFMLRTLFKMGYCATYLPEVIVKMRAGGASNASFKHRLRANREDRQAWKINELNPYFFTTFLKPLRKVFQFI
jgi:glycosyltransferase